MIVDADKVKELKNLAVAFALLELPGQPRAMHMGTSYLVNQLMSAVESQAAEIENLETGNAILVDMVHKADAEIARLKEDAQRYRKRPEESEEMQRILKEQLRRHQPAKGKS